MKTMILVPSFGKSSPIHGAFLFAKYLQDRSLDVLFVSLDDNYNSKENIIDEIAEADIEFKCLYIRGWRGVLFQRSRIRRYVKEKDVDLVLSYALRPTLLTASLPDVVRIASVRGMLRQDYALSYGYIVSSLFVFWEMKALQKMDHVFAMTKPMLEWLVSEGIELRRISVVNNFVDAQWRQYNPQKSLNRYRKTDFAVGIIEGFHHRVCDPFCIQRHGLSGNALGVSGAFQKGVELLNGLPELIAPEIEKRQLLVHDRFFLENLFYPLQRIGRSIRLIDTSAGIAGFLCELLDEFWQALDALCLDRFDGFFYPIPGNFF